MREKFIYEVLNASDDEIYSPQGLYSSLELALKSIEEAEARHGIPFDDCEDYQIQRKLELYITPIYKN